MSMRVENRSWIAMPVHAAAGSGSYKDLVQAIERNPTEVSARDFQGNTSLHAVVLGHITEQRRRVALLVQKNEYLLNMKNAQGRSPLELAKLNGNKGAVEALQEVLVKSD